MAQYLAKSGNVSVAKDETYEEKVRGRAAEIPGLKKASSFCLSAFDHGVSWSVAVGGSFEAGQKVYCDEEAS